MALKTARDKQTGAIKQVMLVESSRVQHLSGGSGFWLFPSKRSSCSRYKTFIAK